ncbi:MAG: hypothetical protein HY261_02350 [Chloroflexi bacterium]|nr:hypothetical protein [Chloroflexota bacterium]
MLRKRNLLLLPGLFLLLLLLAGCGGGGQKETPAASPVAQTPAAVADVELFNNGNVGTVSNNPLIPTTFTLTGSYTITSIANYHWNSGKGATPGQIGLKDSSGKVLGTWNATGSPGQGGVPNALWTAKPNIVLGPGTYTIVDSDPATWANNSQSKFAGMTFGVRGIASAAASAKGTATPATSAGVTVPLVTKTLAPSTTDQQVTWNNQVTVTVPGGLLAKSQALTISRVDDAAPDKFAGFAPLATYDVTLGDLKQFAKSLTIEIAYDPAKLESDLPPDQSILAEWWDATHNTWWRSVSQVDTQRNAVVISTDHLTRWRITSLHRGDKGMGSQHFIVVWNPLDVYRVGGAAQVPETFAKKVSDYLEAAYQNYLAQCYWLLPATKDESLQWPCASRALGIGRTWVVIDQAYAESQTDWLTADITLKTRYDNDDQVKHDTAHELFHTTHLNHGTATYIVSKWWAEAIADYAATRIAWTNLAGMSMVSGDYFTKPLAYTDDAHEYETARFVEYLVGHGISFNQLFNDMAAQGDPTPEALAAVVQKATSKSLLEQYRNFAAYALFDSKGPINPITLSPTFLKGLATTGGIPANAPNALSATQTTLS